MLIVDGYNLMFHESWKAKGSSLEEQRDHLISRLIEYRQRFSIGKLVLVFDGRSWPGPYNQSLGLQGIDVIYATQAGRADDKIVKLCRENYKAKVITADRQLGERVKKKHGKIITPSDFIRDWNQFEAFACDNEGKKATVQSKSDVDQWLDIFGLDAEIEIPTEEKNNRQKRR